MVEEIELNFSNFSSKTSVLNSCQKIKTLVTTCIQGFYEGKIEVQGYNIVINAGLRWEQNGQMYILSKRVILTVKDLYKNYYIYTNTINFYLSAYRPTYYKRINSFYKGNDRCLAIMQCGNIHIMRITTLPTNIIRPIYTAPYLVNLWGGYEEFHSQHILPLQYFSKGFYCIITTGDTFNKDIVGTIAQSSGFSGQYSSSGIGNGAIASVGFRNSSPYLQYPLYAGRGGVGNIGFWGKNLIIGQLDVLEDTNLILSESLLSNKQVIKSINNSEEDVILHDCVRIVSSTQALDSLPVNLIDIQQVTIQGARLWAYTQGGIPMTLPWSDATAGTKSGAPGYWVLPYVNEQFGALYNNYTGGGGGGGSSVTIMVTELMAPPWPQNGTMPILSPRFWGSRISGQGATNGCMGWSHIIKNPSSYQYYMAGMFGVSNQIISLFCLGGPPYEDINSKEYNDLTQAQFYAKYPETVQYKYGYVVYKLWDYE